MRVIRSSAGARRILADAAATRVRAVARGGRFQSDVEAVLGPVLAEAEESAAAYESATAAARAARAEQRAHRDRCRDAIASVHGDLYNRCGRPGNDPVFAAMYGGRGFRTYARHPAGRLPLQLRLNAMRIEKNPHPQVPAEIARAHTAELRALARGMAERNQRQADAAEELALATAERATLAERAQRELLRLRTTWENAEVPQDVLFAVQVGHPNRRTRARVATP